MDSDDHKHCSTCIILPCAHMICKDHFIKYLSTYCKTCKKVFKLQDCHYILR